jgi:hypothetical protein
MVCVLFLKPEYLNVKEDSNEIFIWLVIFGIMYV